ncbi:DUF1801 domain-containing protein [Salinibacterium sp. NSLL150]|uniref:DUF1801 domain-containing protein n=1 Tax=unclassified Salinibacterium TaxID=2632331 RepID=UPI0018CD5EB6|nr:MULTISPECIES: DUF1801 domain-containing protein [unclassified Salinibacterium]MBH0099873.1 DUF1801 domain-containing protein [Salinibacterium sp. NSLL35]MBH0102627.1 DUF1801 domain-containing protein [Salinibacterium sp. NSLL150]MBH0105387.1 DUF1801 domain-containing protein [Salinibacterium sp. NSLL16]MBH0108147.1 DUF1801 domain-containing protein [Salinibacterium sp. NSLL17]
MSESAKTNTGVGASAGAGAASSSTAMPAEVAATFSDYPEPIRAELLTLRELILATASETDGVGTITETLKWGEPAYLTKETRSGSTIRIAPTNAKSAHDYAMFFICSTNLVSDFRAQFGDTFAYEGDRAVLFNVGDSIPADELRECVRQALTYHLGPEARR